MLLLSLDSRLFSSSYAFPKEIGFLFLSYILGFSGGMANNNGVVVRASWAKSGPTYRCGIWGGGSYRWMKEANEQP